MTWEQRTVSRPTQWSSPPELGVAPGWSVITATGEDLAPRHDLTGINTTVR